MRRTTTFVISFLGERKKVLNWLLSYNPLWLRIGLEVSWDRCFLTLPFRTRPSVPSNNILPHPARSQTIYGELISLESNSDVVGLAMFILQRLLWNPDIAAEFRHAKVPHLYKDGNLRSSTEWKRSPHSEFKGKFRVSVVG